MKRHNQIRSMFVYSLTLDDSAVSPRLNTVSALRLDGLSRLGRLPFPLDSLSLFPCMHGIFKS